MALRLRDLPLGIVLTSSYVTVLARSAHAEGMPQLDFASPLMLAQVVWLAIIFFALYILLSRWGLPQVGAVLEKRAGVIAADLEAALRAKEKADAAVAELTRAGKESRATAQQEIAAAVAAAKGRAEAQAAEAKARLDGQIAEAEQRIAAARAAALGALEQVAAETTNVVVARLIGTPANSDLVPQAVAGVLARRAR
jgi:F-type H+-transporting ATPase subunit b